MSVVNPEVGTAGDELVIYPTRTKLAMLALGSLAFVGLLFMIDAPAEGASAIQSLKYQFAVIVGIPFFMLGFVYTGYRLLVRTPALIASRNGLFIGGHALSAGWIAWHEIANFHISQVKSQRFLSIELRDEPAVMSRMNFFVRSLAMMNKGLTGYPLHVPQSVLPVSVEELRNELQAYQSAAKL